MDFSYFGWHTAVFCIYADSFPNYGKIARLISGETKCISFDVGTFCSLTECNTQSALEVSRYVDRFLKKTSGFLCNVGIFHGLIGGDT